MVAKDHSSNQLAAGSTWNEQLAKQCHADIQAGLSIKAGVVKIAPKGFISDLRNERKAFLRKQQYQNAGHSGGISASEVRAKLKMQGFRDRKLTRKVNELMAGKKPNHCNQANLKVISEEKNFLYRRKL